MSFTFWENHILERPVVKKKIYISVAATENKDLTNSITKLIRTCLPHNILISSHIRNNNFLTITPGHLKMFRVEPLYKKEKTLAWKISDLFHHEVFLTKIPEKVLRNTLSRHFHLRMLSYSLRVSESKPSRYNSEHNVLILPSDIWELQT
jgi:hypothetical protein